RRGEARSRKERPAGDRESAPERRTRSPSSKGPRLETYRIEVGHAHSVQPGNIVGALANEAGLDGRDIGHIDIREDHSFVDLPPGMPEEVFENLQAVRVRGTELRISRVGAKPEGSERPERRPPAPKGMQGPRGKGTAPRHGHAPKHRGKPPRR
ncbi:MAG: DbpA RNA binding domain-containing protein, partial [Steroidobacteraceae bacterium]